MNVLVLVFLLQLLHFGVGDDAPFRIVAGRRADIKSHPYIASLETFRRHFCGGSIVSKHFIVTAAHCVKDIWVPSLIDARVGAQVSMSAGWTYNIKEIILYDTSAPGAKQQLSDIALLKTAKPIAFNSAVQPIELADRNPKGGEVAIVIGYGNQKPAKPSILRRDSVGSIKLMGVNLTIQDQDTCQKYFSHFIFKYDKTMICAKNDGGNEDACQGDSGGPMIVNNKLVGITSWGDGCGGPHIPSVYTNVFYVRDFITMNIGDDSYWG